MGLKQAAHSTSCVIIVILVMALRRISWRFFRTWSDWSGSINWTKLGSQPKMERRRWRPRAALYFLLICGRPKNDELASATGESRRQPPVAGYSALAKMAAPFSWELFDWCRHDLHLTFLLSRAQRSILSPTRNAHHTFGPTSGKSRQNYSGYGRIHLTFLR